MLKRVSVSELKAHLSAWIRAVEAGDVVIVTRRDKQVAGMVPAAEMERLAVAEIGGPEKGLAGLAGGWQGSEELVERVAAVRRAGSRPKSELG